MPNPTLEDLLRMKVKSLSPVTGDMVEHSPEFRVAVQSQDEEGVHIIVHANGHNSHTLDLIVAGNTLRELNNV